MIMALLLGLGAMVVSLLGVKCIRIGSTTDQTKARMAVTGGVLNILSGQWTAPLALCCFGPGSRVY